MSFCQSWYISSWRLAWLKSKMKQHSCGPEWFFSVLCFYLFIIIFFCEDIVTRRVPPLLRGCSSINSLREDLSSRTRRSTVHRVAERGSFDKEVSQNYFHSLPLHHKKRGYTLCCRDRSVLLAKIGIYARQTCVSCFRSPAYDPPHCHLLDKKFCPHSF